MEGVVDEQRSDVANFPSFLYQNIQRARGPPDPAVLINRPPLPLARLSVLEMQNSLEDDLIKKNTQVSLAVEVRLPAVIITKEERCCHFMLIFRRRFLYDIYLYMCYLWRSSESPKTDLSLMIHLFLIVHVLCGGGVSLRRLICLSRRIWCFRLIFSLKVKGAPRLICLF